MKFPVDQLIELEVRDKGERICRHLIQRALIALEVIEVEVEGLSWLQILREARESFVARTGEKVPGSVNRLIKRLEAQPRYQEEPCI